MTSRCMGCGSIKIVKQESKDYSFAKGAAGAALFGSVGAIAGVNGITHTVYQCQECGKVFDQTMDPSTCTELELCLAYPDKQPLSSLYMKMFPNAGWNSNPAMQMKFTLETYKAGNVENTQKAYADAIIRFFVSTGLGTVSEKTIVEYALGKRVVNTVDYSCLYDALESLKKLGLVSVKEYSTKEDEITFYSDPDQVKQNARNYYIEDAANDIEFKRLSGFKEYAMNFLNQNEMVTRPVLVGAISSYILSLGLTGDSGILEKISEDVINLLVNDRQITVEGSNQSITVLGESQKSIVERGMIEDLKRLIVQHLRDSVNNDRKQGIETNAGISLAIRDKMDDRFNSKLFEIALEELVENGQVTCNSYALLEDKEPHEYYFIQSEIEKNPVISKILSAIGNDPDKLYFTTDDISSRVPSFNSIGNLFKKISFLGNMCKTGLINKKSMKVNGKDVPVFFQGGSDEEISERINQIFERKQASYNKIDEEIQLLSAERKEQEKIYLQNKSKIFGAGAKTKKAAQQRISELDAALDLRQKELIKANEQLQQIKKSLRGDTNQASNQNISRSGAIRHATKTGVIATTQPPIKNTASKSDSHIFKIEARAAGNVFRIDKEEGDTVVKGQSVVTVEALGMEIPMVAPRDGIVVSIDVSVGQLVDGGTILATLSDDISVTREEPTDRENDIISFLYGWVDENGFEFLSDNQKREFVYEVKKHLAIPLKEHDDDLMKEYLDGILDIRDETNRDLAQGKIFDFDTGKARYVW